MDVLKVITQLGAERAVGRATINEGGNRTIVARIVDGEWALTDAGEVRAKALRAAPKKRSAKPTADAPPTTQ